MIKIEATSKPADSDVPMHVLGVATLNVTPRLDCVVLRIGTDAVLMADNSTTPGKMHRMVFYLRDWTNFRPIHTVSI